MYQNIYYERQKNLIHLWDDTKGYSKTPYKKYGYIIDKNGDETTITGLKVSKINNWTDQQIKNRLIFEHDVPATTRFLIDRYEDSDEISTNHNVLTFDIEYDISNGYTKPDNPIHPINAIAAHDTKSGKYRCWLLDETGKTESTDTLTVCGTELDLLVRFLTYWNNVKPTIITGWNIEGFDIPYLINRCYNVLGETTTNKFSPIGIIEENKLFGDNTTYKIAGISVLDYIQLYKKFCYNEESSYTLEAICQKELKRGKVKYEGTLQTLYETDINKFVEYNISDVELVVALDKKLDYIQITQGLCHECHIPYEEIWMQSRLIDGAALTFCRRNKRIAINSVKGGDTSEAEGAYVKLPSPGIYKYVFDLDLESMYPSTIRTLNISPETKFGKIQNWDELDYAQQIDKSWTIKIININDIGDSLMGKVDDFISVHNTNMKKYLDDNNLSVSSNGILYKMDNIGLIPSILTTWFNKRKEYNKLVVDYKNAGDNEKYRYYDKKQLIQKILLNSFYGVLLMPGFRFYDKDNGEAVTLTGQSLIKFAEKSTNLYYQHKLQSNETQNFVLYIDTDSLFCLAEPLINKTLFGNSNNNEDEITKEVLKICKDVQDHVNDSFNVYAERLHNVSKHNWYIKQELVGRRAYWGSAKKRYAIQINNKKGMTVDELEVKGLDIVRSSFPKAFRIFLKDVIVDILGDKDDNHISKTVRDYKSEFVKKSLVEIMLPTGVKEISKYSYAQKGTPVHVKSAQNYNKLLEIHNINSVPPITDGDKLLWSYVKKNPYGFESFAIKGYDDPEEITDFITKYIDKDKIFQTTLISKIQTIFDDLKWKLDINESAQDNDFF